MPNDKIPERVHHASAIAMRENRTCQGVHWKYRSSRGWRTNIMYMKTKQIVATTSP